VIAVHGLGGNWQSTWTASNGKLWLRDFLPLQLQQIGIAARVLSFGYDSESFFTKSISDIDGVASIFVEFLNAVRQTEEEKSRPIIILAHSLGGIIIKRVCPMRPEKHAACD